MVRGVTGPGLSILSLNLEKSDELNAIRSTAERILTFQLQCMSLSMVEASVLFLLVSESRRKVTGLVGGTRKEMTCLHCMLCRTRLSHFS